jgi:hypothetical protein
MGFPILFLSIVYCFKNIDMKKLDKNRTSFILAVLFTFLFLTFFVVSYSNFSEFIFGITLVCMWGSFWNWLKFIKTR